MPACAVTSEQTVLPIYPPPGSRVRVPADGGGYVVTWTMGPAETVGGVIVIRCVGAGEMTPYIPSFYRQTTRSTIAAMSIQTTQESISSDS